MKRLILILGPNGVGKSSVSLALLQALPHSAYVDSDWCRMMNPPPTTAGELTAVRHNLLALMRNYFECPGIETVIFPYGFHGHRRQLFTQLLDALRRDIRFLLCPVVLECSEAENLRRMRADGRDEARIARALDNSRGIYENEPYPRLDVTDLTVAETAERILALVSQEIAGEELPSAEA